MNTEFQSWLSQNYASLDFHNKEAGNYYVKVVGEYADWLIKDLYAPNCPIELLNDERTASQQTMPKEPTV